jgi:tRNA (guanosine-2'-O-)-methyltransferase
MTDRRRQIVDSVLAQRQPDLTVLAEQLHKPRNFSAIVRTCDAVGINEVHAVPGGDGLSIHWKTSQGAEKWVRVRRHASLLAACAHLRERGFQLVAAHPDESAADYRDIDYTVPTALLVGTELFGVSEAGLAQSDLQITIPMKGMTRAPSCSTRLCARGMQPACTTVGVDCPRSCGTNCVSSGCSRALPVTAANAVSPTRNWTTKAM